MIALINAAISLTQSISTFSRSISTHTTAAEQGHLSPKDALDYISILNSRGLEGIIQDYNRTISIIQREYDNFQRNAKRNRHLAEYQRRKRIASGKQPREYNLYSGMYATDKLTPLRTVHPLDPSLNPNTPFSSSYSDTSHLSGYNLIEEDDPDLDPNPDPPDTPPTSCPICMKPIPSNPEISKFTICDLPRDAGPCPYGRAPAYSTGE